MKKLCVLALFFVFMTIYPVQANAPKIIKKPVIDKTLLKIIHCESGGNQKAIGMAGEIGILQFMPKTWKEWTDTMGTAGKNLDIHNSEDQIIVYNWAAKKGLLNHWTCYRNLYGMKY